MNITYSICRVCKVKADEDITLFDLEEVELNKFHILTSITISPSDGLPQQLCKKCKVRLKVAYDFRNQAIDSHKDFENLLLKIKAELESISNVNPTKDDEDLNLLVNQESPINDKLKESNSETILISECNAQTSEEDFPLQETDEFEVTDNGDCDAGSASETIVADVLIQDSPKQSDEQDELFNSGYFEGIPEEEVEVLQSFIGVDKEDSIIVLHTEELIKKDDKIFQCDQCSKTFSTKTNLVRHLHSHSGSKKYQCKICGNCFTQSGSLKQHMYIHTGERPFSCKECGRSFTQAKSLQFHMRRHTGEKPFPCELCNAIFRQRDGLKRHIAVKHNKEYKDKVRKECPLCLKTFITKARLEFHVKRHLEKGELFRCSIDSCDQIFLSDNDLQLHEYDHNINADDTEIIEAVII